MYSVQVIGRCSVWVDLAVPGRHPRFTRRLPGFTERIWRRSGKFQHVNHTDSHSDALNCDLMTPAATHCVKFDSPSPPHSKCRVRLCLMDGRGWVTEKPRPISAELFSRCGPTLDSGECHDILSRAFCFSCSLFFISLVFPSPILSVFLHDFSSSVFFFRVFPFPCFSSFPSPFLSPL